MEERLKDLWSQVLGCEQPDLKSETKFFELGEDSVVAIRLVGLANDTGLQLDAQTVFMNPVLSDLAALCKYPKQNTSLEVNKSGTIASRSLMDSSDVVNTCLLQCRIESNVLEDIIPCSPFQRDLMTTSQNLGCWIFQAVFELEAGSEEQVRKTFEIV